MSIDLIPLCFASEVREVGGKAAALGRLFREKLLVPNGFVIPVAAYQEHIGRAFAKLPAAASPRDREAAILRTPVCRELAQQILAAWKKYIKTKAAVRSSATVEDSAKASFAGQYYTQLHVADAEKALKAIRRCWASLFSAHATAYSDARAAGSPTAQMAVIVQEMVDPIYAGVAFTREPDTGSEDVFYAEWVAGLGEMLVSGKSLDGRVWLSRKGGMLRADYLRGDKVPNPVVWSHLIDKLKRVEQVFGPHQDVEWAWTGRKIVLIQARPDTHIIVDGPKGGAPAPWILPGRPAEGWTEDQLRLFKFWDEYNPPVVYPLDFQLYMAAIWQANLDMLDSGQDAPQIEQVVVLQDEVPLMIDPAARAKPLSRKYPRGKSAQNFEAAMDRMEEQVRDLEQKARNLAKLPDNQLLGLINRTASVYRDIQVTRMLKGMNLWIEGEKHAKKMLRRILRPLNVDVDHCIEILEFGVDHETSRMNRALREIAAVKASEGKTKKYHELLDTFLKQFGHFQSDGTLICESREAIESQIDRIIESGASGNIEPYLQARALELFEELRSRLQEGKRRQSFERAATDLRHWVALRENSKMRPELPLPLLKQIQTEAGRRLKKRGFLKKPEDIKLLTPSELRRAFEGRAIANDLLERRAALIEWKSRHRSWLPAGFFGKSCGPDDPVLFGISGSPGVADGPARIVHGPDQFGEVLQGDVVIARSTNPVWTQLFNRIAAIVVENGSRLSHAAIVAREVGIPAVVGILGVLDIVRDGEQLRVDGTAGEVIRLDSKKEA